jgi:hypothetical protein
MRLLGTVQSAGIRFQVESGTHTGPVAHPASYPVGPWGSSLSGVKQPGCRTDLSPPSSAEVRKMELYSELFHTSAWRGA